MRFTLSGLGRLERHDSTPDPHKVLEELKDTVLWVRFANLNYLESFELDGSGAQNVLIQPGCSGK